MKSLQMIGCGWIALFALAQAQDKKPAGRDPDAATIAAYKKHGAYYYHGRSGEYGGGNLTMVSWTSSCEVGEKDVPRFHFWDFPEGPLPAVAVPFGLDLSMSRPTDANLRQLAGLKNLRSLSLWKTNVSDAGLKELAGLKSLAWLDLSETPVTGAGLKELAGLKNLATLYLDAKQLTDANLRLLRENGMLHVVAHEGAKYRYLNNESLSGAPEKLSPRPRSIEEVTSFNLRDTPVTDGGLRELAGLKNLVMIDLRGTKVTVAGLKPLAGFPKLASIRLHIANENDARLQDLAGVKNLPLTLYFDDVTDAILRKLRELRLLHTLVNGSAKDGARPRSSAEVIALDLRQTQVTAAGLKELVGLENLATLRLTWMTDAALKELAACKSLAALELRHAKMTPAGLKELAGLKKLVTLNLVLTEGGVLEGWGGHVSDAHLRALREVGCLHGLASATAKNEARARSVDEVIALDLTRTAVTETGLKEIAGFKNLASLKLGFTEVTGAGLKNLAGFKNLTELDLGYTKVTDVGLKDLAGLTNLTSLELSRTKITDAGLKELTPLKNLVSLSLFDTQVTDRGLKELAAFKNLASLYLIPAQLNDNSLRVLRELDLLHTLYQARTPGFFNPAPKSAGAVIHLDLSDSKVTDKGLKELAGLKNLEQLTLARTKVTSAGIAELRKALPKCQIAN